MKAFTLLSYIILASAKYNSKFCNPGKITKDDCNFCICTRGYEWQCTEMNCNHVRNIQSLELTNETDSVVQAREDYTSDDLPAEAIVLIVSGFIIFIMCLLAVVIILVKHNTVNQNVRNEPIVNEPVDGVV